MVVVKPVPVTDYEYKILFATQVSKTRMFAFPIMYALSALENRNIKNKQNDAPVMA